LLLAGLRQWNQNRGGDGLGRFRQAVAAIPAGGEAHVWIRVPIQMGDVVMALPSIFTVIRAWEAVARARGVVLKVTITGKRSVSLFREAVPQVFAACHVDEEFPPARSPLKLIRHWEAHKPLAVINYSKSDRIKLAAWYDRIPVRAGIADGGNNWSYHFCHPFAGFNQVGHRVFRHLPMTRWLAGPDAAPRFEPLGTDRFGGASVLDLLRQQGWTGGPYVVFGVDPFHRNPERRWFPLDEPWLRLCALARAAGVTPVLAGAAESRARLDLIAHAGGGLSLAGRTDLPQLLALVANALGTIAVDTGIAHLAAATGKPTVVIFGWGSEALDLPCGPKVVSLRGDPAGESAYPIAPGSMAQASTPWCVATSRIPAERAWGILNYLAGEGAGAPLWHTQDMALSPSLPVLHG